MKTSGEILVTPRSSHYPVWPGLGFWPFTTWPAHWRWWPRNQAEQDEAFLQIIPYAILENADGHVWCYRRTGGDARLADRLSCGVGGHVERMDEGVDLAATVMAALRRELAEELGFAWPDDSVVRPEGWIYEGLTPVGRVHLGLVFRIAWTGSAEPLPCEGEPLARLGFQHREVILADPRFEHWSHLALQLMETSR